MENECTVYPILQKYYSSLQQLNELNIEKDIFSNISKVDTFFAEFRNITFVMQKSFNTEELKSYYVNKRDEIFKDHDMKWFVTQRNNITKHEPFKLEKGICVTVYLPSGSATIMDDRLTIDNDISFNSVLSILRAIFSHFKNCIDIFFTIELSFRENETEVNIYDKIRDGILVMDKFVSAVAKDYPCDCRKCAQLKEKIKTCLTKVLSKDLSFVWDCSFENGNIVFGDIIGSYMGTNGNPMMPIQDIRSPIKDSIYDTKNGCVVSLFQNFASYHLTIYKMQNKQIMPVFMLIFNDDTFSFLPFTATTKATFYRMTLYVIKMIKAKGIKTVFYAGEYYSYPVEQIGRLQKPYEKRVQLAEKTFFSCSMISKDFSTMLNIDIDIAKMEDMDYIKEKINSPQPAIIGWLQPIYDSFNK